MREDDPQLTVRHVATSRQPLRVVVDSRLETPAGARLLAGAGARVFAAVNDAERIRVLENAGAKVTLLPDAAGKVDLAAMMAELGCLEINEVLVEAGFRLNGSLLQAGLVDEMVMYLAPHLLGDRARGMFDLPELTDLSGRRELEVREVSSIGTDLRITARFKSSTEQARLG